MIFKKPFYAISVFEHSAQIVKLIKHKRKILLLESSEVPIDHLQEILNVMKKRTNVYVSIAQHDFFTEMVPLPEVIKKEEILITMVRKKYDTELQDKEAIFHFFPVHTNRSKKTITYLVNAIFTKQYQEQLALFPPEHLNVKSATVLMYAVVGLFLKRIDVANYILAYTIRHRLYVFAIRNKEIVFMRTVDVDIRDDEKSRDFALANEISMSINYIRQENRTDTFETLILTGSLVSDQEAVEQIALQGKVDIAVATFYDIIEATSALSVHKNLSAWGVYYLPKRFRHIPNSYKSGYYFRMAQNTQLALLAATIPAAGYITYERYKGYEEHRYKTHIAKRRLQVLIRRSDLFSVKELDSAKEHINMMLRYNAHDVIDTLIALKPILNLTSPHRIAWKPNGAELHFGSKFNSLDALYQYEKRFHSVFQEQIPKENFTLRVNSNYKSHTFSATIVQTKPVALKEAKQTTDNKQITGDELRKLLDQLYKK